MALWVTLPSSNLKLPIKKLRRLLQLKRHLKIELCVRLSVLRWFHVGQVAQNSRSSLSPAWHEWFSCQGREWKDYWCWLKHENFTSSFGRLRQKIAPTYKKKSCTCGTILKIAPHVQHDYFSSCSESNHWFLALSLLFPSSFLKLPIAIVDPHLKYYICFSVSLLVLSSCGVQFASSGTIRPSSSPRCACGTCQWILARSRYRRRRSKFDRTKQKSVFTSFY